MKIFLISILLVIQIGNVIEANLDYRAPSYFSMLANSDLIILSEIVNQTDTTITLRIEEILKGEYDESTLKMRKFKDWPCASRHLEYQIGQKQINILREHDDTSYRGMSPGNENELPIEAGFIYCKSWLNKESKFRGSFGKINGFKFKFDDGLKGIRNIIDLAESFALKENECNILNIESKTNMEAMIIEEHIMRMKLKHECANFDEYKFQIINQKMYWH